MNTPTSLNDTCYPSKIAKQIITDLLAGHYGFPSSGTNGIILHGPYGTGKSTVAALLPDAIEARFSGQPAKPVVRKCRGQYNKVKFLDFIDEQSKYFTVGLQTYHYFVLDEVDHLTNDAKEELKMIMDPVDQNGFISAIFIMTTNKIESIDPAVRDRSIEIPFEEDHAYARLPLVRKVLEEHGITDAAKLPDELLYKGAIQCSQGSVRKIISQSNLLANQIKAQRKKNSSPALKP